MKNKFKIYCKQNFPLSKRDTFLFFCVYFIAILLCLFLRIIDDGDVYVSMIFLLAVAVISRITHGYFYGSFASMIGVVFVNYIFTYPYFHFDFTYSGYPISFISMFTVSIIIGTMTTRIKEQEKLRLEAETERMRSNLLRAISHDLRTPLTSILGSSSAILENDEYLSKKDRAELLTEVKEDAQWLIRMVENLLSITRIHDSPTKIEKQAELAEEIIAEAVQKTKKHFPLQEINIHIPDEILFVPMDAMLIEQVLINLLENAIKHSGKLAPIDVYLSSKDSFAIFEVQDHGRGIEKGIYPHLFDGYFQERYTNDDSRSMGIGLSVCMSIIKAHNGTMDAKNNPTKGATFTFFLPLEVHNHEELQKGDFYDEQI